MTVLSLQDVLSIAGDVPNYQAFLTVDELNASSRQLASRYPDAVQLIPIGHSRLGDPIEALKIGAGTRNALLFALPHPNEPIGSMTLEYLSQRLAADDALRRSLDFTWYMVKCIDPDGTRLNEGWFKGPFSVENYARHFYRPPFFQQVEWTFPIDYKTLHFHDPLPETQALMQLIEQTRPDFLYSLHNAGFGGVYFYLSADAPSLYEPFYALVASQDLPLHLGEPEMPYVTRLDRAVYVFPSTADMYDFYNTQGGSDPATFMKMGTSSFDYARAFGNSFGLVCEMPYFYSPSIHDGSPSDTTRRSAILQMVEQSKSDLAWQQHQYESVKDQLTVRSPFRDALEDAFTTFSRFAASQEQWAQNDPATAVLATVAEKFDSLVVNRFYRLLRFGMFVRMLDAQIAVSGASPALVSARETALAAFEARSASLIPDLAYAVIPIQKLVRVQLGSALLAAGHVAAGGSNVSNPGA
jgi:hypothetical protein